MLTYAEIMAKAISDSVVASRKLIIVSVVLISLCTSVQAEANLYTLWVNRRSTTDLYSLNSKATVHEHCDPSASYLIEEKQCALNEELFNGM